MKRSSNRWRYCEPRPQLSESRITDEDDWLSLYHAAVPNERDRHTLAGLKPDTIHSRLSQEMQEGIIRIMRADPNFLHAIAEAAFLSDLKHYRLLRPVLLNLKKMYPANSWLLPLPPNVKRPHDLP